MLLLRVFFLAALAVPAKAETHSPTADVVSSNRIFMDTFLERCLPAAHAGTDYGTDGMTEVRMPQAARFLAGQPGSVWAPRPGVDVLLILPFRARGCQVMSRVGDPEILRADIENRFAPENPDLLRKSFSRLDGGGFQTSYEKPCANGRTCLVNFYARGNPRPGLPALLGTAAIVR